MHLKSEKNINHIKMVRMDVFLIVNKKLKHCVMKKGGNEYELYAGRCRKYD
mgnify:CR=1 FL=1